MLVKAKLENHNEWLFLEEIPEKYVPNHHLSERQVNIKNAPVEMKNYQLSTNGLFLLYSEMNFGENIRIETELEGDAIASQFIFSKGKNNAPLAQNERFARGRHNIRYIPTSRESYEVKSNQEYIYFLVVLSKDYYLNLVDTSSALHEDFMREIEKGGGVSFVNEDLLVTPEMTKVIESIRQCKHDGGLKRMFTDARIMELIIYQLEQFSLYLKDDNETIFGEDVEKLEAVREFLELKYVNPPTQKELSRFAAINESKLRTGFKKYYGTTIYDFITRLRMVEARRLIIEEKNTNMSEVSMLVGFKHQSNFTRAFKRYYGLSPTEVTL